jgi:mono/diheme cytochrome c family protein
MLKCKGQEAVEREQPAGNARRDLVGRFRSRFACVLMSAFCLLVAAGCRRDMQDQPKAKPFRSSSFFKDGLASRAPVEGTVARGWLRADTEFFAGKKAKSPGSTAGSALAPANERLTVAPGQNPQTAPVSTAPIANASASQVAAAYPDDVDKFPFQITKEILDRGQERFQIYCSVCHGMTGNADGIVVRRGFRKPPSYYEQRLREAPVGHFFDVVTNGWGAMPSYASQVGVQDRWAIIAYIRALQLSQVGAQPATQTTPEAASPMAKATPAAPKTSRGRK